jgi:hypothetical protein
VPRRSEHFPRRFDITLPAILPSFPRPFPGDAALTRSSSDPTTFAVWTRDATALRAIDGHIAFARRNTIKSAGDVRFRHKESTRSSRDTPCDTPLFPATLSGRRRFDALVERPDDGDSDAASESVLTACPAARSTSHGVST